MPQAKRRIVRKLIDGLLLLHGKSIQHISLEATQDLLKVRERLGEETYPTYGDVRGELRRILASVGEQHAEKIVLVQELEDGLQNLEDRLELTPEMDIVRPPQAMKCPRPAAMKCPAAKRKRASINMPAKKKKKAREIKYKPGERVEVPAHPFCLSPHATAPSLPRFSSTRARLSERRRR